ncbi:MAG: glutathione S-transferase family protein [Steroidobacteraceae bacterium]
MIDVYGDERSGNCLKVKWVLEYVRRPLRWHHVDILRSETRTPEFLALNPAGQVPTIRLEDGRALAQSNAIVLHFAEGTDLIPSDAYDRAKAFEWLFWEQYSHEPSVAVRRFQKVYLGKAESEIDAKLTDRSYAALARMECQLEGSTWLVGEQCSVADLCLLPYTRLAPEGGLELQRFPALSAWIDRTSNHLHSQGCSIGD